jgi:O-antigen ligase
VAAAIACAISSAVWPTFTLALAALAALGILAWRAPAVAFLLAVALFGFEGALKIRLAIEGTPFGVGGDALGAGILDAGLVIGLAGLAQAGGVATARRAWNGSTRAERVCLALVAVWLVVSLVQIPQGGHLRGGLEGYRLIQFYVVAVAGGALAAARVGSRRAVALLALAAVPALAYGAVRGVIGPAALERAFAVRRETTPFIPGKQSVFRNVGSFSSAVGLASYATPLAAALAAFAIVSWRRGVVAACVGVFALATAALLPTYVRSALVAIAAALFLTALMVVASPTFSRRRKLVACLALAATLLGGAGATFAAGRTSPAVERRTAAILHPLRDPGMQQRLDTWRRSVRVVRGHPLGEGLGTVGRASRDSGHRIVVTDNSYLELLQQQGIVGVVAIVGLLGTGLLAGIAIVRSRAPRGAGGIAAVAGFAAFAVLAVDGEYIEQPGKVVAWTLLGVAVYSGTRSRGAEPRQPLRIERPTRRALGVLAAAAVCAALVAIARPASYRVRAQMFPVAAGGLPAPGDPAGYVEARLRDPALAREVAVHLPNAVFRPERIDVRVADASPRRVSVEVRGSPTGARELANRVELQLVAASQVELWNHALVERRGLAGALPFAAPAERRRLQRRIARLDAVIRTLPPRLLDGVPTSTPPARGLDRALELLPGELPGRPHPLWAALAALAALAACITALGTRAA